MLLMTFPAMILSKQESISQEEEEEVQCESEDAIIMGREEAKQEKTVS